MKMSAAEAFAAARDVASMDGIACSIPMKQITSETKSSPTRLWCTSRVWVLQRTMVLFTNRQYSCASMSTATSDEPYQRQLPNIRNMIGAETPSRKALALPIESPMTRAPCTRPGIVQASSSRPNAWTVRIAPIASSGVDVASSSSFASARRASVRLVCHTDDDRQKRYGCHGYKCELPRKVKRACDAIAKAWVRSS